ncbi:MAG TPA: HAMP domain-containing sensor histidine kinase, partial [Gaiellaceae bacterium]|nr:HAMP domain-containing sensor histidine kinase [Gaiellaceae bacterium]
LRLENGDVDAGLHEVERLADLVDGLLALARADAGAAATTFDAAEVVRERAEHWAPLAAERGVRVAADTNGEAAVHAARDRVVQVLDNLVANALAVAPAGSAVTIAARPGGEIHVLDEGPGLTPEQRARAFDRFWRAGPGGGGSGLGLAIVRRLVEADGGSVELEAAQGGGVDAVVRLRRG